MLSNAFRDVTLFVAAFMPPINNAAAIRVLEKLGLQREGYLSEALVAYERWWDHYFYAMLDHE